MVPPHSHHFELDDTERAAEDVVSAALTPRYTVVPNGRPRLLRRTWLDTFDWRLHRAGLCLSHVTRRGRGELALTSGNGERVTAAAGRARWPALADAVPAGPLRERVSPVAGMRALLPAVRTVSTVSTLRVCNADDKTVAWVTAEDTSVAQSVISGLPTRLSVSAVRGYQPQADRIAQLLAGTAGVKPATLPPLDAAMAAAGRRPGDYTGKINVALTAAMPARLALATVLLQLLDTLEANVAGTVRDLDTEFLHDLRIAVRRTRTALKLGGAALPGRLAEEFRGEFKWLGDATTPTRDLDVYLLGYDSMAAALAAATPAELAPFHDYLARHRAGEQRRLARALRSPRFARLTSAWRLALTGLTPPAPGPGAAEFAAGIIGRAHRRVLKAGAAITADSAPERLHDLRKRCKELRYALEFFASLHDPVTHRKAVRQLKDLQDCLGTFQDCQVQQHEIRMIASEMMESGGAQATTLLAMGELAAQAARRESQARSEFSGRFGKFASKKSRRRFRALSADVES
jgi:CHAD domain-containing protein